MCPVAVIVDYFFNVLMLIAVYRVLKYLIVIKVKPAISSVCSQFVPYKSGNM